MQAWTVLTPVAEALPGPGRKQLKISVIKVKLRTVPRTNDEIPTRTTRPESPGGVLPCVPLAVTANWQHERLWRLQLPRKCPEPSTT